MTKKNALLRIFGYVGTSGLHGDGLGLKAGAEARLAGIVVVGFQISPRRHEH